MESEVMEESHEIVLAALARQKVEQKPIILNNQMSVLCCCNWHHIQLFYHCQQKISVFLYFQQAGNNCLTNYLLLQTARQFTHTLSILTYLLVIMNYRFWYMPHSIYLLDVFTSISASLSVKIFVVSPTSGLKYPANLYPWEPLIYSPL